MKCRKQSNCLQMYMFFLTSLHTNLCKISKKISASKYNSRIGTVNRLLHYCVGMKKIFVSTVMSASVPWLVKMQKKIVDLLNCTPWYIHWQTIENQVFYNSTDTSEVIPATVMKIQITLLPMNHFISHYDLRKRMVSKKQISIYKHNF